MSSRQIFHESIAALKLPSSERDVVISCRHLADPAIRDRIQQTPPRQPVQFTLDELGDLHRELSFDASQTNDNKRRKAIAKIVGKIDRLLEEQDDRSPPMFLTSEMDAGIDELGNPQELFDELFGKGLNPLFLSMPVFRVSLTRGQRETLLALDTVPADIHKTINTRSSDEQAFDFSMRQMIVTSLAVTEALGTVGAGKARQMLESIARRISDGFCTPAAEESEEETTPRSRQSQSLPAAVTYQLKITLEGSKPPIWRRILVADCTLDVLHEVVQVAMGWENYHMHMFEWGNDRFSPPNADLGENDYDETQVLVSQLVAAGCKKLRYWYDFGDDWWHTIKIEKTLQPNSSDRFPRCTDGAGNCPPEDCGGIWGYYEFLDAIRDPKHEQHDELVEWAGDDFDPERFDLAEVNEELAW